MIRGQLLEIREESRAIVEYLEECVAAARDLDASVARTPARRSRCWTVFPTCADSFTDADVHIAKAGERLVNEAMLRELNEQRKKGAA